MAITTRYFSTSGAGAADGTTWNDRAALFSAGNWSTVITGFDFTSNSMLAYVGPGSYSCSQSLVGATFTVAAPTITTPLTLHACNSSGVQLDPPNKDWTSDTPVWDLTDIPVIATTTNIATFTANYIFSRLIKYTASGRNGVVLSASICSLDWCVVVSSTSNTAAIAVNGPNRMTNCVIQMTGTAFDYALGYQAGVTANIRLEGNASASSGNRRGLIHAATGASVSQITATGFVGGPVVSTSTNVGHSITLHRCTLVNNTGSGVLGHSTASQTAQYFINRCMVTGNGAYGINADASNIIVTQCRLRDNTSGNTNALGNYPADLGNYTTDSDDATEYVDAGNGDFRIKSTATIAGMGFGVSDQPATAGGASSFAYVG